MEQIAKCEAKRDASTIYSNEDTNYLYSNFQFSTLHNIRTQRRVRRTYSLETN